RIEVDISQTQQTGFVIETCRNTLDEREEIQSHNVQMDAYRREILLNHGCQPDACLQTRIRVDGKLDRLAFAVVEACAASLRSRVTEKGRGAFWIEVRRRKAGVEP